MKTMSKFTKNKYNMYLRKCNFDRAIIKKIFQKVIVLVFTLIETHHTVQEIT